MRRLVTEQRAGVLAEPVPAAEIVGAVARVEVLVEVHRDHLADCALLQQRFHLLRLARVPRVQRDGDVPAGAAYRVENGLALVFARAHRLFGDHVEAEVQRAHDVLRRAWRRRWR